MDEFDTVVAHYSTSELLELIGVSRPTTTGIILATTEMEQRYASQPKMVRFFQDVQTALLDAFPEAKRTVTRLISVDSYYRDTLADLNTDTFSFYIAEKLTDVVSIALYSIEIPYSWYTFSAAKGTNCIVLKTLRNPSTPIQCSCFIADGNYTAIALKDAVTASINSGLISLYGDLSTTPSVELEINPVSACLKITVSNLYDFPIKIVWFDPTFTTPDLLTSRINKSLGWALGFRSDSTILAPDLIAGSTGIVTVVAPSLLSVNATKSIFMQLDDHIPGRFVNSVVSLGYIDPSIPSINTNTGELSYRSGDETRLLASGPRRMTAKQIFSFNAKSDSTTSYSRVRDIASDSNLFAKIPLKKPGEWGFHDENGDFHSHDDGPTKTIVEFSGPLQLNLREYFGTVTLSKMSVSIFDDRGNSLGLNGMDWAFTLIVKQERTQN